MFIDLHEPDGTLVMVNLMAILYIRTDAEGSAIHFRGSFTIVKESPEEIKRTLMFAAAGQQQQMSRVGLG